MAQHFTTPAPEGDPGGVAAFDVAYYARSLRQASSGGVGYLYAAVVGHLEGVLDALERAGRRAECAECAPVVCEGRAVLEALDIVWAEQRAAVGGTGERAGGASVVV